MLHLRHCRLAILLSASMAVAGLHDAAVAKAGSASPRPARRSPFLGRWELDLTRMPSSYGVSPKQVIYDFADIGQGRWRTTIDITAPDNSVRHMVVAYRRDGTLAAGEGDTSEADTAAIITPAPNVLIMNLVKNKRPGSVRVYTVSPDGKEMSETSAYVADGGEPMVRSFHYKRLS